MVWLLAVIIVVHLVVGYLFLLIRSGSEKVAGRNKVSAPEQIAILFFWPLVIFWKTVFR